ncbi:hypothetical protein [uncultured Roseibium sp.]|uniref:hypothetical protein n=1 Tax=uncultured Roseibium sp. TaxID=1936171 RepID=UPI003216FF61
MSDGKKQIELQANNDQNVEALTLDIEKVIQGASNEAAINAVERVLRARGADTDINNPNVFKGFYDLDPELADYIIKQNLTLKDLKDKQELEARYELLKSSLSADKKRQEIFSDKKVVFFLLGIPTAVFTLLTYTGQPGSAAFFLLVSAVIVMSLLFSRSANLEGIIDKFLGRIK